jgi:hypothetical protein
MLISACGSPIASKYIEELNMRLRQVEAFAVVSLALILSVPAIAARANERDTSPERAVPGTLNYVEGTVSIGSQAVNAKSIGTAQLENGQSLTTGAGKAEILLTPGAFLRVGDYSAVKMISSGLTDTKVGLDSGHAIVEVAEIHPENDIRVIADGATTELLKTGLYDFDLNQQQLRVFEGKAAVAYGDGHFDVKSGHEVSLLQAEQKEKKQKFDKKTFEADDLYRWSSLRSSYVAEANVDAASIYANSGWGPWGPGWWGAGWYWDPWFDGFTFIPGGGVFYSPFGWGFYSPWWVYRAPFYGGYGYRGLGVYHHFSRDYHSWGQGNHYVGSRQYEHGVYRGTGSTGGFHSGARFGGLGGGMRGGGIRAGGFGGGGFHGGVGFHGGGGFHGR